MGIRKQNLQNQQLQQLQKQQQYNNTIRRHIKRCSHYQQHIIQPQHQQQQQQPEEKQEQQKDDKILLHQQGRGVEVEHRRSIEQSNQRKQAPVEKYKHIEEIQNLNGETAQQQQQQHNALEQRQQQQQHNAHSQENADDDENVEEISNSNNNNAWQLHCKQYDAICNKHKVYKTSTSTASTTTNTTRTPTIPPPTKQTENTRRYHKWRSYANVVIKISYLLHGILSATILLQLATTTTPKTTIVKHETQTQRHCSKAHKMKNKFLALLLLLPLVVITTNSIANTTTETTTTTVIAIAAITTALRVIDTKTRKTTATTTTNRNGTTSTLTRTLLLCCVLATTSVGGVSGAIVGRQAAPTTTNTLPPLQQTNEKAAGAPLLTEYRASYDELTVNLMDNVVAAAVAANNMANSNEQQLLKFYERAQQQQQQQQHHAHHYPSVDFDELPISMADVVSTLSPADVHVRRRATKRAAPLPQPATTQPAATTITTTASMHTANEATSLTSLSLLTGSTKEPALTLTNPTATTASDTTTATNTSAVTKEKCEPKVLDEVPTEPFYDFTDIAEYAAVQFTEFLSNKFGNTPKVLNEQLREEVRRRANGIASAALNEADNLLAFAIAAPSIHTVVVKFRENVTIPPEQAHNKAFLGSYWRELGYAWNSSDGTQQWGAPFRDCNLLVGRWLWPFRITYSEAKIKIVVAAFIAADEDVCNDGLEEIFGRRHGCDNTTFCLLTENKPAATRDVYTCICREGFYLPNSTLQGFRGDIVEQSEGFDNYSCIPCPSRCTNCDSSGVCLLAEPEETVSIEYLLNVIVSTVLAGCILCCKFLSAIVFRQRKSKAIASGMWLVLETILLGIALLYASVSVHLYPASTLRCLLEPWLRELGFIICYGAIILKLYRHLVDFRTRKAHRLVLRDVDLLKYLSVMVVAVMCYMSAFTASSYDLLQIAKLESLREEHTNTCRPLTWEYVTQASEICILAFGLQLAIASRNANTQYRERQFLVTALAVEFIVSATFYSLRFLYLNQLSPGAIFLALFLRSQLTNTVCLGLIFVPKFWYQHKQVRSLAYDLSIRLPVDAFKGSSHDAGQRLGGGYAGLCLGDPDIGELTIAEMSPEDIRAELKRLYTQLEILKNKSLRQDNPHISKRRGGRKAGHRRFSLQKKGSKDKALSAKHRSHKHHQDIEITEAEPSRTPEDSVCSAEGPTDTFAEISGISHSMLSHSVVSHSAVSHSK